MQGGRIIEDRYLRKRQTVTIGESPKATFVLPFDKLPIPKLFPIFLDKKSHFELAFTESMSGKMAVAGKLTSLQDLLKGGKAKKRGKAYVIPIKDDMRGTVKVGEVTIIFHLVQAPPIPAKPKLPASIRGGWIKSIDWVYVGILFCSFLLHAGVFGYASTQPIPKIAAIDKIPDRFAKIIVQDLQQLKKDNKELEGEGESKKVEKTKSKKKAPAKKAGDAKPKAEKSAKQLAEEAARRKAEIAKKVAGAGLVALLTSKAPGGGDTMNALADTLADGARFGSIDDTMSGVSGLGVATKATQRGRRGGGGGGPKSKGLSDVGTSEGGSAELAGRKEKQIKASAKLGALQDVDGSLDASSIKKVVKRHLTSIKHCYEQELRRNPKMEGKVTVEVTVASTGAVSSADVLSSSLGNNQVEKCMLKTIKRWRFPRPEEGDVIFTYPFIFEAVR